MTAEPLSRQTTASPARAHRTRRTRYRLGGTRCDRCGLDFLPPREVCPNCHSRMLVECEFGPYGTVVVAGEDRTPLMGHTGKPNRPFALVRLDEGPTLLAELVDVEFVDVAPKMPVEMVLRKWKRESNGLYQYGYKFRPRYPA